MTESMLMPVVPTSDRTIASRALLDEVSYADGLLATGERGIGYLLEDRAPGSTSRPTTTPAHRRVLAVGRFLRAAG